MNHIELFSGCGGLCLGLSNVGFKLLMANELSPMAAETFAFNHLSEDLSCPDTQSKHTLWISSNFTKAEMSRRLREDPRTYPADLTKNSDLLNSGDNLNGSLIVGSILSLNKWLAEHPEAKEKLATSFGEGDVDLVSGGPPCQSFSLAGLREKNNEKNSLPWAFAQFANMIRPKFVLLENVTGILRPFIENGERYHAWFEVSKAFANIGYVPLTLHINAKFAGVAQNRPRFILIGVRKDIYKKLKPSFNGAEQELFESSEHFFDMTQNDEATTHTDLVVHDLNKSNEDTIHRFKHSFLAPLCTHMEKFVSVKEAIDDLGSEKHTPSSYVKALNKSFSKCLNRRKDSDNWSHRLIDNLPRVRRRFRIYQILNQVSSDTKRNVYGVLSGKVEELSESTWEEIKHFEFLMESGSFMKIPSKLDLEQYLRLHLTKKQTQRALISNEPAPAALSIPDDACHYRELRTLTAREMARIQSFPDDFIFRSKMTTGGDGRKFEVPIYTQIGNAVPVLLGQSLGLCVKDLLSRL